MKAASSFGNDKPSFFSRFANTLTVLISTTFAEVSKRHVDD